MAILNSSVVLPVEYGREIIRGVLGRSKALELGRRLPDMRGKTYKLNVLSSLPVAGWVKNSATPSGAADEIKNKPISDLAWQGKDLVAEEIAVIIPVSLNTLRDVENYVDIVPEITEQVVGAFQQVIDATIFFGVGSPWANFNGIVADATTAGATVSWNGTSGVSFYNAVNDAMEKVENSGYVPTAILGGPSLNSAFRKTITELGVLAGDQGEIGALPRHIDLTGGFNQGTAFAIVGDFRYLVYSFREEMEMRLLEEATLVDPATGSTL
ncbi:MAG: phage major capsid protein, partial [Methanobrevibacter sp.]|nr:phage major capsid protein [Methanobrevibacter sp.]